MGKFVVDSSKRQTPGRLTENIDDITDESSTQTLPETTAAYGYTSRGKGNITRSRNHTSIPLISNRALPALDPQHRAKPSLKLTPNKRESFDALQERQKLERSPSPHKPVSRNSSRRATFADANSKQGERASRTSVNSIVSLGNLDSQILIPLSPGSHSVDVESSKITFVKTIQLPKENYCQNITSTAMLDDGNIVLCDQKNASLSLYNSNFRRMDEIKFSSYPHNVAKVSGFGVASTFPDEKSIRLFRIENNSFDKAPKKTIENTPSCRGIQFIDGKLFYTTENVVAVLPIGDSTETTETTQTFKHTFRKPMSLYVGHETDGIYVTCYGNKETGGDVVKMNVESGAIEFVANDQNIFRPVCTGVDRHGYIYVCNVKPHGVHQLGPDGHYIRKILG